MKRWMKWAALLYPAAWRKRYDAEFATMLEQIEPRWSDVCDVMRGGLKMQLLNFRFQKVVLAVGVAGAIVASGFAMRITDRYSSRALLRIRAADSNAARDSLEKIQQNTLSRNSLFELILKEDLFRAERQRLPIEDVVMAMKNRHIRISPAAGTPGDFQVEFSYRDPDKAEAVTQELAARFLMSAPPATLELIRPAASAQAESPNRLLVVLGGFAAGLVVGMLIWRFRRWPVAASTGI